MVPNLQIYEPPPAFGRYLRVGGVGYRQLETLLCDSRLPFETFVAEAALLKKQKELIASLQQKERELVLDTNVAELAVVGRF